MRVLVSMKSAAVRPRQGSRHTDNTVAVVLKGKRCLALLAKMMAPLPGVKSGTSDTK